MGCLNFQFIKWGSSRIEDTNLFKLYRGRGRLSDASSVSATFKDSWEIMAVEAKVLVGTYKRAPVVLERGKGCILYDVEGREYLDMTSGIAVNALGHGDPDWVRAVGQQAGVLSHVSNVYYTREQVQCGLGRTGHLWAHEAYGVYPDMMTLAKPLAGGLPIGAVLLTERVASTIGYGEHGSTFAGSPGVCKPALVVLEKITRPGFFASVARKGKYLKELLAQKIGGNAHVREVRGLGLIVGIELDVSVSPLVDACHNSGLLILTARKGNVVRLIPPLIISEQELHRAVEILSDCLPVLNSSNS